MSKMDFATSKYNIAGFSLLKDAPFSSGIQHMRWRHSSGLQLELLNKSGFSKRFAAFGIPYGSASRSSLDFAMADAAEPAGIAHYLEHCVFYRDEQGGLMGALSAVGAEANAYTTYKRTVYYFSTLYNFKEALSLYLQALFLTDPDEERVEAERGIIAAEISMYMDDIDATAFHKLMSLLYLEHPAKEDIAGSHESISLIDAAMLRAYQKNFYNPHVMSLALAGDFPEAELLDLLQFLGEFLNSLQLTEPLDCISVKEPARTQCAEFVLDKKGENASFIMAIKDDSFLPDKISAPKATMKRNIELSLLLDSLIGESSGLYNSLYDETLINDSFDVHYFIENDFAFVMLSSESYNPKVSAQRVLTALREELLYPSDEQKRLFELQKRVALGSYLHSLDSIDGSGMAILVLMMYGLDLQEYVAMVQEADFESARAALQFIFQDELCVKLYIEDKNNLPE